jgi:hypothetical protein
MDQRLVELLKANEQKIGNKFDYLFIYLHAYIENCFPQKQVRQKLVRQKFFHLFFESNQ